MRALIIGGTRNLGPSLVEALLAAGHQVAVFNRGQTPGVLPDGVERLCGDRDDASQLQAALGGREFELVVDTTLYTGPHAETIASLLDGRVGRYVVLSTGQVYLVRLGLQPPFREDQYDGEVMPRPPEHDEFELDEWSYGAQKRDAEDALMRAWAQRRFPVTVLRLPMVNSERDHFDRIYGYLTRLWDGGPILVPSEPGLLLRHVYGGDVIAAILQAADSDAALGRAFNVSQDETSTLEEFLAMLGERAEVQPRLVRLPRARLEAEHLLPTCSPFSGTWMSRLDNRLGVRELGLRYTPLSEYLTRLVSHYQSQRPSPPIGYDQRPRELELANA